MRSGDVRPQVEQLPFGDTESGTVRENGTDEIFIAINTTSGPPFRVVIVVYFGGRWHVIGSFRVYIMAGAEGAASWPAVRVRTSRLGTPVLVHPVLLGRYKWV